MNNFQILVSYKASWGKDLFYPINEIAELLTKLIGRKSLMRKHFKILKKLGYEIIIEPIKIDI